jgi:hypothetical protein
MSGGAGADTADYGIVQAAVVVVTLDGNAGDGPPGESDNVQVDIENVRGGGDQDTFTGSDVANVLDTGSGEDYLDGKRGADDLRGGSAADAVLSRDSSRDLVTCGPGIDFVVADRRDAAAGCEIVDRDPKDHPVTAKRLAVQPVKGTVGLGLPAAKRYVPLTTHANVPVGMRVDATDGAARLAATARRGGGKITGRFSQGAFKATQKAAARPVTDIALTGGDFGQCTRAARGRGALAKRKNKSVVRRLWSTAKGSFRTRGRYASAGVRGTTFEVEDRCDGTLVTVTSGSVVVVDFVTDNRIIVNAGDSYLARAPR